MTQEIVLGIGLFTGIVFVLGILVLVARSRLLPSGSTTITINDSRELQVPIGEKLLTALSVNNIFVPAACGGNGSCGQCRVKVVNGGGEILPIETSFISKREAAQGQRLACQVSIQADAQLQIQLPEAVFSAQRWHCRVRDSQYVATYIKELILELPAGDAFTFQAGGYVQVECPPHALRFSEFEVPALYQNDWTRFGLFQLESVVEEATSRAYSMANCPEEKGIVILNVRIATPPPSAPDGTPPGKVSSWLFGLQPGDPVTLSGPFGNFCARESEAEMIFVGGGAGMAPLRSIIFDQLQRLHSKRKISFWYGARSVREAFYADQFQQLARVHSNFTWELVMSEPAPADHWTGHTGFIHRVLFEQYLGQHSTPEDCEYYLCGPPMMIAAMRDMLDELGVDENNIFFDDFGS